MPLQLRRGIDNPRLIFPPTQVNLQVGSCQEWVDERELEMPQLVMFCSHISQNYLSWGLITVSSFIIISHAHAIAHSRTPSYEVNADDDEVILQAGWWGEIFPTPFKTSAESQPFVSKAFLTTKDLFFRLINDQFLEMTSLNGLLLVSTNPQEWLMEEKTFVPFKKCSSPTLPTI